MVDVAFTLLARVGGREIADENFLAVICHRPRVQRLGARRVLDKCAMDNQASGNIMDKAGLTRTPSHGKTNRFNKSLEGWQAEQHSASGPRLVH